jgi:hypothetical protein
VAEEVGAAFVSLLPSARGFSKLAQRELRKELRGGLAVAIVPEVDERAWAAAFAGRSMRVPVELDPMSRTMRVMVDANTAPLRAGLAADVTQMERSTTLRVPMVPGDRADFERRLRAELTTVSARTRMTVRADVDVDDTALTRTVQRSGAQIADSGGQLGRLFSSGFGSSLLNPLIGIPVAVAAAMAAIPTSTAIAAASLAGAGLGAIFVGAFALRSDPLLQAAAKGAMTMISETFTKAAQPLRDPLVVGINTIATAIRDTGPQLQGMFKAIAPSIPVLAEGVGAFVKAFTPGLVQAVKSAGPVLEQIAFALPDLGNALGQFLISMTIVAPQAADFIGKFLRAFADIIRLVGGVVGFLALKFGTFLAVLRAGWQIVKDVWSGLGAIFDGLVVIFAAVRGEGHQLFSVLSGAIQNFREIWQSTWSGITRLLSGLVDAARSLPGRIVGAIGNTAKLLFNAGRNVISGLIDGIKSMFGSLGSAMRQAASTIRNYLPFSPAKVGPLSGSGAPYRSGQKIASELAGGMTAQLPTVRTAADQLAAGVARGASGTTSATAGMSGRLEWAPGASGDPLLDALRELIRARFGGDSAAALGTA